MSFSPEERPEKASLVLNDHVVGILEATNVGERNAPS